VTGDKALDEWKEANQEQVWTKETIPMIETDWAKKPKQTLKHIIAASFIKGDSVLDVGCGTGDLITALELVNYNGAYLGIDQSNEMLKRAQQKHPKHHFIEGNLYGLQHIAKADTIVGLDVLHHQKDIEPGFSNLLSMAKKRLIVTLWINNRDAEHPKQRRGRFGEFITYYTEEELKERFQNLEHQVIKEIGCQWKDMYIFEAP